MYTLSSLIEPITGSFNFWTYRALKAEHQRAAEALAFSATYPTVATEAATWAVLVEYVEQHDLNGTPYDPRVR